MLFFTNLRLKLRNFIKEHKNKVIICIIGYVVIVTVNHLLSNMETIKVPITTYTPHEPIFETGEKVSKNIQKQIEEYIDKYIEYCNEKEYEKAYNMISPECRQLVYPTLDHFKAYVNYVFKTKKIYNIQNYSNKDNKYIYRIRILDDILATGLTYESSVKFFEDKMVFEVENDTLKMGVKEYVGEDVMEKVYEDKYMKIVISKKITMVEQEIYTLKITNRTSNYLILKDNKIPSEITASTTKETIEEMDETAETIKLGPEGSITKQITFLNFFDEGNTSKTINFNNVRVLKNYTDNQEENLKEENIIETYATYISVD